MMIDEKISRLVIYSTLLILFWVFQIVFLIMTTGWFITTAYIIINIGFIYLSDNIVQNNVSSEKISYESYPELHTRVNKIANQTNISKPDIALIDSPVANIFTKGYSTDNCTITFTKGIIDELDYDELEAVISHEVSHIKSKEFLLVTVFSGVLSASYTVLKYGLDNGNNWLYNIAFFVTLPIWIVSFVLAYKVLRYREYMADRGAVNIMGSKHELESALLKLDDNTKEKPKKDLRLITGTYSINFVDTRESFIFKIHPKVSDRIEYIRNIDIK